MSDQIIFIGVRLLCFSQVPHHDVGKQIHHAPVCKVWHFLRRVSSVHASQNLKSPVYDDAIILDTCASRATV